MTAGKLSFSADASLAGTSRCDVIGGEAAEILRPLGARTAQRAVPAGNTSTDIHDQKSQPPAAISASKRLTREWTTMAAMVRCHCQGRYGTARALCPECQELLDYAAQRLEHCRFGAEKPTCANCPVHCYQRDRREQMKAVMRHAGPRMLWRHPVLSLRHWLDGFRPAPTRQKSFTITSAATPGNDE